MKLAVLGLGGVGRVIAKTAANTRVFDEVICADIDPQAVSATLNSIGKTATDHNCIGRVINASDYGQVKKLALESFVLINATLPRFNLIIMEACLAGNCHYIDLVCETLIKTPGKIDISKQLSLNSRFLAADLLALTGVGIGPGCSNIFARYLSEGMDRVEEVLFREADVSSVEGYKLALYYSPETFLDDCCTKPPFYYESGKFFTGEPLRLMEEFTFPEPIGKKSVYGISHQEVWTFPRYTGKKGLKKCNYGYSMDDNFLNTMNVLRGIGLDKDTFINVKGVAVAPRDLLASILPRPLDLAGIVTGKLCVGTLVRGFKNGRAVCKFMYNMIDHQEAFERMEVQGASYQTGIPGALVADLLAEGVIKTRGVLPPEACEPGPIVERLPEYGLNIITEDR